MLDECLTERDELSAPVNERLEELLSLGDARGSYEPARVSHKSLSQMTERVPTDFDNAINHHQQ